MAKGDSSSSTTGNNQMSAMKPQMASGNFESFNKPQPNMGGAPYGPSSMSGMLQGQIPQSNQMQQNSQFQMNPYMSMENMPKLGMGNPMPQMQQGNPIGQLSQQMANPQMQDQMMQHQMTQQNQNPYMDMGMLLQMLNSGQNMGGIRSSVNQPMINGQRRPF